MPTTAHAPAAVSLLAAPALLAPGRRLPLSPKLRVKEALTHYLAENGFDTAGYTAPTFEIEAFGGRRTFRNPPARQWAVPLHDLHHVATGYGTDLVGEAEVAAFELRGGCRTGIVYALNLSAFAVGIFLAPLRMARALRDARGARALFRQNLAYDDLLALSLGELRRRLGIPANGVAHAPRRLHDDAEGKRPDALPSAPPIPRWSATLAMVEGLFSLGAVAFELARGRSLDGVALGGAGRAVGFAVAALSVLLVAGAPRAQRGSLGGRALLGTSVVGLVAMNLVAVVGLGMSAPLALAASAPLLILLTALIRS